MSYWIIEQAALHFICQYVIASYISPSCINKCYWKMFYLGKCFIYKCDLKVVGELVRIEQRYGLQHSQIWEISLGKKGVIKILSTLPNIFNYAQWYIVS